MNFVVRSLVVGAGVMLGCHAAANAADMTGDCRIGIYRLSDNGKRVSFAECDAGEIRFDGPSHSILPPLTRL